MKSRGVKGLAVRYRPQTFGEIVGHEKLLSSIQTHWFKEQKPTSWMFSGRTGCGKTTFARILAVSANCPHQPQFGYPCKACRSTAKNFDIVEINASDMTGIDRVREAISAADYVPVPPSQYRVYIFDEAQRMSDAAQNLLLKPFEDGPATTLWIICTTVPTKILPTLKRRCVHWQVGALVPEDVEKLVQQVIESERSWGRLSQDFSPKQVTAFTEKVLAHDLTTPGLVLAGLEKFLASGDPDSAITTEIDAEASGLGRAVYEGDWNRVRMVCQHMTGQELISARYAVMGYLRVILLNKAAGDVANKLAAGLVELTKASAYDEATAQNSIIAAFYAACQKMKKGGNNG